YIARHVFDREMAKPPFQTVGMPSGEVRALLDQPMKQTGRVKETEPDEVIVALEILGDKDLSSTETVKKIILAAEKKQEIFAGSSPDLPFAGADHWCGENGDTIFSNRSAAERLHGIDYLQGHIHTTGRQVNVVIVDQGLD